MIFSVKVPFNMFLLLLLLIALFDTVNANINYDTVICVNEDYADESHTPNYTIKGESIMFFESPNFPQTMYNSSNEVIHCKALFYTENSTQKILFMTLYGKAEIFLAENPYSECLSDSCFNDYDSNFDNFKFVTTNNMLKFVTEEEENSRTWRAFKTALIAFDPTLAYSTCPLSNQTFDFTNATDMLIPITSDFYLQYSNVSKNCFWGFKIGANHLLKVVVKNLTVDSTDNFEFILFDDEKVVQNFTQNITDTVFYFNGTTFNFTFTNENSGTNFFIIVSVIQKFQNYVSDGCKVINSTSSQHLIFTNINNIDGYPAYQHCENKIIIPDNHEATLYLSEFNYESCCDNLILTYGINNQSLLLKNEKERSNSYILTSNTSGMLDFYSDGNTQGAGFEAILNIYECECADMHLLTYCDGYGDEIQPMKATNMYCSNMDCYFEIIPNAACPDNYLSIQLNTALQSAEDELKLYVNGSGIQIPPKGLSYFYYPPGTTLTPFFTSGPPPAEISKNDKYFWGGVGTVKTPNFQRINLNQTISKHFLALSDMKEGDAITVCATTGILEIFISGKSYGSYWAGLEYFQLFDSANLTSFVGTLDTESQALVPSLLPNRPRSRKSISGCFTLYALHGFNPHSVLFKIENDDCKNNVYQIPSLYASSSMIFKTEIETDAFQMCEFIFFAAISDEYHQFDENLPFIWIKNITTGSNILFSSTANNNTLFYFSNEDELEFQDIGIYTPALSVFLPHLSKVIIDFLQVDPQFTHNIIGNSTNKGILASPSFAGEMTTFNGSNLYNFYFDNIVTVELKFIKLYGSSFPVLQTSEMNKTLTEDIKFITNKFSIYYSENDVKNNGFLIEYKTQPYIPFLTSSTKVYTDFITNSNTNFEISSVTSTPNIFLSSTTKTNKSTVTTSNGVITRTTLNATNSNTNLGMSSVETTANTLLSTTTKTNEIIIETTSEVITSTTTNGTPFSLSINIESFLTIIFFITIICFY